MNKVVVQPILYHICKARLGSHLKMFVQYPEESLLQAQEAKMS